MLNIKERKERSFNEIQAIDDVLDILKNQLTPQSKLGQLWNKPGVAALNMDDGFVKKWLYYTAIEFAGQVSNASLEPDPRLIVERQKSLIEPDIIQPRLHALGGFAVKTRIRDENARHVAPRISQPSSPY